jgi:hypothetical protein
VQIYFLSLRICSWKAPSSSCLFQLTASCFFILDVFINTLHTEISVLFSVYDAMLEGIAFITHTLKFIECMQQPAV